MAFGGLRAYDIERGDSWNLSSLQFYGLQAIDPDVERRLNIHRNRIIALGRGDALTKIEGFLGLFTTASQVARVLDHVLTAAGDVIEAAEKISQPTFSTAIQRFFGNDAVLDVRKRTEETKQFLVNQTAQIEKLKGILAQPGVKISQFEGPLVSARLMILAVLRYAAELEDIATKYSQANPSMLLEVSEFVGETIGTLTKTAGAIVGQTAVGLGKGFASGLGLIGTIAAIAVLMVVLTK